MEKAHPDIFNILLQVMDHGKLTDANGREADFRNVVLVMTTNAGAEQSARRSIGFSEQDHSTDSLEVIRKTFSPEFRNRLDAIISFKALDMPVVLMVVELPAGSVGVIVSSISNPERLKLSSGKRDSLPFTSRLRPVRMLGETAFRLSVEKACEPE